MEQTILEPKKYKSGFLKYMKAMDDHSTKVSKILQSHLLAEYFLDEIIASFLKRGDILLERGRFSFMDKLLIVKSFDVISDQILGSIKNLNSVRNNCAHQLEYEITESDIDLIGRPFGKEYSTMKLKEHDFSELLANVLGMLLAPLDGARERIAKL